MANPVTIPPGTPSNLIQQNVTARTPNIPIATDLPSALAAIRALTAAINVLTNSIASTQGASGSGSAASTKVTSGFVQEAIRTKTVKITDPNDSTVFVTVQQIVGLTMVNPVTGEKWVWSQ